MDEVLNITCTAYYCFSNGQSKESAFFLLFCRDIYIPTLADLLKLKLTYLGDMSTLLSLEKLRRAYMFSSDNLKKKKTDSIVIRQKNSQNLKLDI